MNNIHRPKKSKEIGIFQRRREVDHGVRRQGRGGHLAQRPDVHWSDAHEQRPIGHNGDDLLPADRSSRIRRRTQEDHPRHGQSSVRSNEPPL